MALYYQGIKEFLEVDYALSDRSKCRGCKQKIQKFMLRISVSVDEDHFSTKNWHHLNCFNLKPRFKDIDLEKDIRNLDKISVEDSGKVIIYLKSQIVRLAEGKKKPKSKKQYSEKSVQKQKQKQKQKSKAKIKADTKKESVSSQSEQQQKAKKKSKAKKKKNQKKKQPLTEKQMNLYNQLVKDYLLMSNDQLKNILTINGQPKTGSKIQLVNRCADGKLFGRIPLCPQCGGGKLRFDLTVGQYKCPGFMEDTNFKRCNKIYERQEIDRAEWLQN